MHRSQNISVSIATRLRDEQPGFDSWQWPEFFLFISTPRQQLGLTQLIIQWLPRVKQSGCEADNSPPSGVEVKNAWSYTFIPPYVFMAWCFVKDRDDFTFLYKM
jgi:hypothetical protein